MIERVRIDRLLVERGLFESRAKAQAAVIAGRVRADMVVVVRPSEAVATDAQLIAEAEHPWVSRGGVKLAAALTHFHFDPRDRVCLDVGASTGGFSEVLLARGARRVYAVDVGRGQLHRSLRGRGEIVSIEQTDIRQIESHRLPELPDFICIDVSFISLKLALPAALALARPPAHVLALIKPQFEAGRRAIKKGIVRDPEIHQQVCADIAAFLRSLGWEVVATMPSPIAGGDGNREFFIGAQHE